MALRKGSAVYAHKVNLRKSFKGTIVEIVRVGRKKAGRLAENYYVVEDKDGNQWCRSRTEVTPVTRRVTS